MLTFLQWVAQENLELPDTAEILDEKYKRTVASYDNYPPQCGGPNGGSDQVLPDAAYPTNSPTGAKTVGDAKARKKR